MGGGKGKRLEGHGPKRNLAVTVRMSKLTAAIREHTMQLLFHLLRASQAPLGNIEESG